MQPSTNRNKERCREFVGRLQKLDAGERARLKRNAGNSLAGSRKVHDIYWRLRPYDLPDYLDDTYFLVATLFPFVEHRESGIGFGRSLKSIVTDNNRSGLDRRFTALLDADEQQLSYRLRQLIMRFKGNDKTLDWSLLLYDLMRWHYEERYVQLRWARDYFTNEKTNPETELITQ